MEHKDGAWGPTALPGPLPALLGALCTELTLSSTQAQGSSSIPQPLVSKDQKLSCTHRTGRVGEGGTGALLPYRKNPEAFSLGVPSSTSHTLSPCPLDKGTQTDPDVSLAGLILDLILLSTETLVLLHATALSPAPSTGAEQAAEAGQRTSLLPIKPHPP